MNLKLVWFEMVTVAQTIPQGVEEITNWWWVFELVAHVALRPAQVSHFWVTWSYDGLETLRESEKKKRMEQICRASWERKRFKLAFQFRFWWGLPVLPFGRWLCPCSKSPFTWINLYSLCRWKLLPASHPCSLYHHPYLLSCQALLILIPK